ncbi:siderophore-interacting protein [Glycomyces xiaoerkulensis]|uniref:siderophore-interacting protein n=1 Tax=Glycomyces xiaoerkulensis TaxID=2038139 RepID=UPI000C25C5DD|nr:siderophore-interacting protein [Glycomyces xiaoerkulensis]
MGHGWEGAVLKLLRAKDFVFTVTGAEEVAERYRRLHFTDGGMLAMSGVHPTMWVRLWFDNAGKPHQRAYTLVDPDPEAGTFSLEFALHEGAASDWCRTAQPGDTIEGTLYGTAWTEPDPLPGRMFVVGDAAALPAINSLLEALPQVPATIWFETADSSEAELPFRTDPDRHDLRLVPREGRGERLVAEVRESLPGLVAEPERAYVWITAYGSTTRELTAFARKELGVPKQRVHSMAYWR